MKEFDIEMKEKRKIFIETGKISEGIKPYIAESWIRCKDMGIDPKEGNGAPVNKEVFKEVMKRNKDLILVARNVIQNVTAAFKGKGAIVAITDRQGYVLIVEGDEGIKERCKQTNLIEGTKWTEEIIGTNAIDLAILLDEVIETRGAEHYCENHHEAVCISVPIHAKDKSIVGCCTVMIYIDKYTQLARGLAIASTYIIEKEIQLKNFLNIMYKAFNRISECMMIINTNLTITHINKKALLLLNTDIDEVLGKKITQFMDEDYFKKSKIPSYNISMIFKNKGRSSNCIGNIEKIDFNEYTYGYLMLFREEKAYNKMINKFIGNQSTYSFEDIITQSDIMLDTIAYAKRISQIDCSVLITGESGTGKELFAHSIHSESHKRKGPFVAINCAAIPKDLVESEIFGYEEGAFTGAKKGGVHGKFELADGGTLFLDEIGELPLEVQSKLLRVLDNHKVMRVGGKTEKDVDVRVIAATNRDLEKEVEDKNFRLDLYYRINVVNVQIPPLNSRKGDIPLLAKYFLNKLNNKEVSRYVTFTPEFIDKLERIKFNGNIRQLQNIISRAYYLTQDDILRPEHLPKNLEEKKEENIKKEGKNEDSLNEITIENIEYKLIVDALAKVNGNVSKAAKNLEISRSSMYRKMKKHNIRVGKFTEH